jgi:hypothetical protein
LRFARLAAGHLAAVALATPVARVRHEKLPAKEALALAVGMHRPTASSGASAPTNPARFTSRREEDPHKPKKTLLFQNREENPTEERRISDRRFCTAFIPPLADSAGEIATAKRNVKARVRRDPIIDEACMAHLH